MAVLSTLLHHLPPTACQQNAKHAKLAAGKRLTGEQAKGFITSGLFRYSRHPNFWAEQCLWWSMWLFGVAATGADWEGGCLGWVGRLAWERLWPFGVGPRERAGWAEGKGTG